MSRGGITCEIDGRGGAWPGFRATRQPHVSTPNAAGVEGAGGIYRGAGGRRRGQAGLQGNAPATRQHTRSHWCGGRRRDRRARAGFEIDHSEPQARVWRSRGRAAAHRHTQRPGPTAPGTPAAPQRYEAATGFPATASSRSRSAAQQSGTAQVSAVHNSATSDQAVMST